jgi:hypothetical protein
VLESLPAFFRLPGINKVSIGDRECFFETRTKLPSGDNLAV